MKKNILSYFPVLFLAVALILAACGSEPLNDVTEKKWGTAELVEAGSGNAELPQVAMDSGGNAMAVWRQHNGTASDIWANRYVAGTGWEGAMLIETGSGDAYSPQVAMDSGGNALAVWRQYDGRTSNIWASRYVAGTDWGTAELLSAGGSPQVAMDSAGNAIAVWGQWDPVYSSNSIYANLYVPGAGWGKAELMGTDLYTAAGPPQVAMGSGGNAMTVWIQADGDFVYNIMAKRYVAGTGWGEAELIATNHFLGALYPQVAMDSAGNAVVVWFQLDPVIYQIWASSYVVGTGWGSAELIEDALDYGALFPQVAMDSAGNAMAVWDQSVVMDEGSIRANRYVPGTGWDTAELIENSGTEHGNFPQVAMDADGNAIVVWEQNSGTFHNICTNRYVPGTGWGTSELIETNSGDARYPQVAVDSVGNTIAVWAQSDGTAYSIWANRFE